MVRVYNMYHKMRKGLRVSGIQLKNLETVCSSASKSSIRRFVITEKAPTRAFSWSKVVKVSSGRCKIGILTQLSLETIN